MSSFQGIWVPVVTPFHNGAIDFIGLRRLVCHLLEQGVAGIMVCTTTGEAAALSRREQLAMLRLQFGNGLFEPPEIGRPGGQFGGPPFHLLAMQPGLELRLDAQAVLDRSFKGKVFRRFRLPALRRSGCEAKGGGRRI